jgi:micrococcal nuclease
MSDDKAAPVSHEHPPELTYAYKAKVVRVVDGDTLILDADLGFHTSTRIKVRLARVNAPELHGPFAAAGAASKQFLEELLTYDMTVIISTKKTDIFGRWLAEVWLDGGNISDLMLQKSLAVPYKR